MATGARIFRIDLDVADVDRGVYANHALTIARHPSETDERMMVRALAFALYASERLEFGRGIGTGDEPDLCARDLTGRIELWIDVGLPDERRVRKACGQSGHVRVVAYGGRAAELWWQGSRTDLERHAHLEVIALAPESTQALAALVSPRLAMQVLVQDGDVWVTCGDERLAIALERWRREDGSTA